MAMTVRLRLRIPIGADTVVVRLLVVGLSRIEERCLDTHHPPSASRERLSGLGLELLVDQDGSLRALRRRDDHELYVERGVAHDEYSRHAGLPVTIGLDRPLPRELAPELRRERLLLIWPGREEQRAARDASPVLQPHRGQPAVRRARGRRPARRAP